MHSDVLTEILLLLALAAVAVGIFRQIRLPPIFGYLLVGVASGPYSFAWLPGNETITLLAEIGVVFLLFMIGLEFSLAQFWGLRRAVLGLGGIQVLVSTLAGTAIAIWFGIPWQGAMILGGVVSLSSTAVVVKQLNEQLELGRPHGRLALAVLLFQDIAVVPFLVVIPILGQGAGADLAGPLVLALLKGVVAVVGMLAVGHWLIRPVFHHVAMSRSIELFTLTTLLVSLAAAWMTNQSGLSLALGAFLAGMMLSETEFKHQIESDVRPFRDVLMGLFFISVGTQLDLWALPMIWQPVLLITAALILGKALVVAIAGRVLGYGLAASTQAGLVLGNGGEFGFALITLALSNALLTGEQAQPVLAAVIFSMLLAPVIIRFNGDIVRRLFPRGERAMRESGAALLKQAAHDLSGHVVLCGYGRIGQNLGTVLRMQGFQYVALDMQPQLVKEAFEAGEPVFYGDSTQESLLEMAGLANARLLMITLDDLHCEEQIIKNARRLRQDLPIVVRTRDDKQMEHLESLGATLVLAETLEASMMMTRHLLQALDVADTEIISIIDGFSDDHFHRLRGYFHGDKSQTVVEEDRFHLHTVTLGERCDAVGKQVDELDFGKFDVVVATLIRDGVRGEAPEGAVVLREHDAVVLEGTKEALEHAESVLFLGTKA